jgi:hypothetical protein
MDNGFDFLRRVSVHILNFCFVGKRTMQMYESIEIIKCSFLPNIDAIMLNAGKMHFWRKRAYLLFDRLRNRTSGILSLWKRKLNDGLIFFVFHAVAG